jgi:Rieske 2Fe-2S family protein
MSATISNSDLKKLMSQRRPGWSLERPFYTDAGIFATDLERIFMRQWLFAGHTSQVRKPGDYFTFEIGNESIIIIRGQDEKVRALFNVCRHRGSRICTEPSGSAKSLVCPYHQWVFKCDGSLASARLMPSDFDKSQFGLHQAHIHIFESMIFVCLAENAPDFSPIERELGPHIRPHGMPQAKIVHTIRYQVKSNWKLLTENFRECYHCHYTHPEYCNAIGFAKSTDSQKAEAENAAYAREQRSRWKSLGIETENVPFRPGALHHCARYPLTKGFVSWSLDGKPVAPRMGTYPEQDMGVLGMVCYPNFWFEGSSDYGTTTRSIPVSATRTDFEVNWYVREDAVAGRDFDVEKVTAVWRATIEQDFKLCEDNQSGVNSMRYTPGPYAPIESDVEHFVLWYLAQLDD